jgi:uncharacterized membrane protein
MNEAIDSPKLNVSNRQDKKLYGQDNPPKVLTTPLPDPIGKSIEAIVEMHTQEMQNLSAHQRFLEKGSQFFEKPEFLYSLLVGLAIWICGSALNNTEVLSLKFPAFSWHEHGLDAAALLISTGVIIRQTRQEKFAEQRSQLMLQLNLLSERKIAKIITLIEELRVDLPNVVNRYDSEAAIMQDATDPIEVLKSLQENIEQELSAKSSTTDTQS